MSSEKSEQTKRAVLDRLLEILDILSPETTGESMNKKLATLWLEGKINMKIKNGKPVFWGVQSE